MSDDPKPVPPMIPTPTGWVRVYPDAAEANAQVAAEHAKIRGGSYTGELRDRRSFFSSATPVRRTV